MVFSGTEHLVEVLDKLSSTSVDFIKSDREWECMHLYDPKLLTQHAQRHAGKCEKEVGNKRTYGAKGYCKN